jgi:hypothetical protein
MRWCSDLNTAGDGCNVPVGVSGLGLGLAAVLAAGDMVRVGLEDNL